MSTDSPAALAPVKTPFIPDGFTIAAIIPEGPYYPEVRIRFRPMRHGLRNDVEAKITLHLQRGEGDRAAQLMRAAIDKHLIDWDIEHEGEPVQKNMGNLEMLEPNLLERLYNTVSRQVPALEEYDGKAGTESEADRLLRETGGEDTAATEVKN